MSENFRLILICRKYKDLTKLFIKRNFISLLVMPFPAVFVGLSFFNTDNLRLCKKMCNFAPAIGNIML